MSAIVYTLRCSDGHYYVGSTRGSLERRLAEHNNGTLGGYTFSRRPVCLIWHQEFAPITDAVVMERRIKGWTRSKKEALVQGDFDKISALAKRSAEPSFETRPRRRSSG